MKVTGAQRRLLAHPLLRPGAAFVQHLVRWVVVLRRTAARIALRDRDHRQLCEAFFAGSQNYRFFWDKLARGHSEEDEVKRIGKSNREVWLQSSDNPILASEGRVTMVTFTGTDITAQHQKVNEFNTQIGQLEDTASGLLQAATALTQTASRMTSSAQ